MRIRAIYSYVIKFMIYKPRVPYVYMQPTNSKGQDFFKKTFGYLNYTDWRMERLDCSVYTVGGSMKRVGSKGRSIWLYIKGLPHIPSRLNKIRTENLNSFKHAGPIPTTHDHTLEYIPTVEFQLKDYEKYVRIHRISRHFKNKIRVICPTCEYINTHPFTRPFKDTSCGYYECSRPICMGYLLKCT